MVTIEYIENVDTCSKTLGQTVFAVTQKAHILS